LQIRGKFVSLHCVITHLLNRLFSHPVKGVVFLCPKNKGAAIPLFKKQGAVQHTALKTALSPEHYSKSKV